MTTRWVCAVLAAAAALWVLCACAGGPATIGGDGGGGPSRAAGFIGHWDSTFGRVSLAAVGDYF